MEQALTQRALAEKMAVSDKTISKWERGLGCPDVTLLPILARLLGVGMERLLDGELAPNDFVGGNMKKAKYFVCPDCGNVTVCTGNAAVSCCGRTLAALTAQKAAPTQKLTVEPVEDEWYITSDHPMQKEHYISFLAIVTGESIQLIKQYPEWNLQARIPNRGHVTLLWYDTQQGLFYQLL
ncbi:MAG: helix-turn-helix domain-containing protein [Oscillospiraceae bacterium]